MPEVIELFTKIIQSEKGRYLWIALIVAVLLVMIVFPYIDANFLYYDRIEKRIDNLEKLVDLTGSPLYENDRLTAEYESILTEMENAREMALSNTGRKVDSLRDRRIKFLSGSSLCFLVALIMPFTKKKGQKRTVRDFFNNLIAAIFCFAIGSLIGWFFVKVPTLGIVEVNAILAPLAQIIILLIVTQSPRKKLS